jgi:GNAT superfamily N-acetyltransferase
LHYRETREERPELSLTPEAVERMARMVTEQIASPAGRVLLLGDGAGFLGAALRPSDDWGERPTLFVWGLYVDPQQRHRGGALALIEAAFSVARDANAQEIQIAEHGKLRGLYKRLGAVPKTTLYGCEVDQWQQHFRG